jgi:hypothetical protein
MFLVNKERAMDISNVVKVYNGKMGCMCGCKGKYSYTANGAENHGPGYDVSDRVNERSVKLIARKVLANPNANRTESPNYVFVEDRARGKIQVVFFAEQ